MTDMKIHDLKWRGLPMWPPQWSTSDHQEGEEGVLEGVQLRHELSTRLISIEANHLGDCRKGILILEDPAQLEFVCDKLRENLGRSLTEIGNLEIDFTPTLQKYGLKQAGAKSTTRNRKRGVNTK
jgi:hypothetical protein